MFGYNYEIISKKEKDNAVVDALFNQYEDEESMLSLSYHILHWVDKSCQEWFSDPYSTQLVNKL
jgi:hypothetical protein